MKQSEDKVPEGRHVCAHNKFAGADKEMCERLSALPARVILCGSCTCEWRIPDVKWAHPNSGFPLASESIHQVLLGVGAPTSMVEHNSDRENLHGERPAGKPIENFLPIELEEGPEKDVFQGNQPVVYKVASPSRNRIDWFAKAEEVQRLLEGRRRPDYQWAANQLQVGKPYVRVLHILFGKLAPEVKQTLKTFKCGDFYLSVNAAYKLASLPHLLQVELLGQLTSGELQVNDLHTAIKEMGVTIKNSIGNPL